MHCVSSATPTSCGDGNIQRRCSGQGLLEACPHSAAFRSRDIASSAGVTAGSASALTPISSGPSTIEVQLTVTVPGRVTEETMPLICSVSTPAADVQHRRTQLGTQPDTASTCSSLRPAFQGPPKETAASPVANAQYKSLPAQHLVLWLGPRSWAAPHSGCHRVPSSESGQFTVRAEAA